MGTLDLKHIRFQNVLNARHNTDMIFQHEI